MSTIAINIKTNKLASDFAKPAQDKENLTRILNLIKGLESGALQGAIFIQTSTDDPVAATATATITYASLADGDTIVIFGVTITCRTGTPIANEFKKETDATVSAVNLAAAINANATLSKYMTATSALGVVTLTSNLRGAIGNFLAILAETGNGMVVAQWTGGTGGPATSPVQIRG